MPQDITAISVWELNKYIKDVFAGDINLKAVTLKGEVSNFTNHIKTGHFYFTLKDEKASIKAIMFKGYASQVPFKVENGMNVIVRGSVQVFERDGAYQLYCQTLEPDGVGALSLAYEQLKKELFARGLFDDDHKKPIPKMPNKIGVVTAKTGAALQDILNILKRRYPICTVVVIPTLVQGENAPHSIVDGINNAELIPDIDLLIVGRGGGSIEDLWAFNDENVAQTIYDCTIPIISAVGHEIDFTIADLVADLRAPTPSAAAELASPDILEIGRTINSLRNAADYYITNAVKSRYEKLKLTYHKLTTLSPETRLTTTSNQLNTLIARLNLAIEVKLSANENKYLGYVSTLSALSPLDVITRGYSITFCGDTIVKSTKSLKKDDIIKTKLSDGEILSQVL